MVDSALAMGGEETGCFAEVRGVVVNSLPKKVERSQRFELLSTVNKQFESIEHVEQLFL